VLGDRSVSKMRIKHKLTMHQKLLISAVMYLLKYFQRASVVRRSSVHGPESELLRSQNTVVRIYQIEMTLHQLTVWMSQRVQLFYAGCQIP